VKLTAPQVEGIMRGIEVRWQRQYNLANFSHYELQVSDDDESWYSLLLDGSGWKGNLNEDTDVKTELFTHANIPLREDAGDLVGISLYYRVRQVTFAEVRGEWSDSAYATTKGVQDVVLTDSRNRYIEISSKKGIYADDRQGHIIHDIPNSPILTGMVYAGHMIIFNAGEMLPVLSMSYTDVNASVTDDSALQNTSLANRIPAGLTNVKGAYLQVVLAFDLSAAKVAVGTRVFGRMTYSTSYNTEPSQTSIGHARHFKAQVAGINLYEYSYGTIIVPVFYVGGVPYITWWTRIDYTGMAAGNANYLLNTGLYLLGVTV
jgi:hypothetical protein